VGCRCFAQFTSAGLLDTASLTKFGEVMESGRRLRDSSVAFLVLLLLTAVGVVSTVSVDRASEELNWTVSGGMAHDFGLVWYTFVSLFIFLALAFQWVWRLIIVTITLSRISRLPLQLVPVHADGVGGLGFLETISLAFSPVVVGLGSVIASRWAHEILYHGVHVNSLRLPAAAFVVAGIVLLIVPLLAFTPILIGLKQRTGFEYSALAARHGAFVDRRWIKGQEFEEQSGVLQAPELGPAADVITLFDKVSSIRLFIIQRRTLLFLAAVIIMPFIPVAALEISLLDLLMKLGATLL